MAARSRLVAGATMLVIALSAFFAGRTMEERALAARILSTAAAPGPSTPVINPEPPSYRQIAVDEILALSFAEFYEALRSAPADARKKWAAELEKMPEGPRRRAAFSGFYKLLVQFDPVAAAKAITEIKDKSARNLALGAAIDAAPGFALPLMAELAITPSVNEKGSRAPILAVLEQWSPLDPAAAAAFMDEHALREDSLAFRELISDWATLDPDAARNWMEKEGRPEFPELSSYFIEGWYENNRAAAVSYVLGHVDDPAMKESIGDTLRSLYFDSKDEAQKFIENLPDDKKRHDAFLQAFQNLILGEEENTGDPERTPRAVSDWVTQFPPEYWKGTLTSIFERSKKAPDAVLAWIEQQPPTIRQKVAAEYTHPFQVKTPEALGPVLRVADPSLRDQLLKAMFKHMDAVLDEARTAVRSMTISPEQKDHVMQIIAAVEAEDQDQGSEE
jgi:hypothetical protein